MTISRFTSTLASRGGRHGEAKSHDEKKECEEIHAEENDEVHEGQEGDLDEIEITFEDRQSQPSNKYAAQVLEQKTRESLMEETPVPTKAKAAQILGNMFNDPRITNVLMLGLLLIGMGGAEAVQSQVCSL